MLVLIETYKPSLLRAARGLICNSGWAADTVQRSITSLRRGERGCEGEKVVIRRKNHGNSMFPLLLTLSSAKLHITIYSLSCLIIIISVPSIYDSPSLSFHTSPYSFVSAYLYPLVCLQFYSSFHHSSLSPLLSLQSSLPPPPPRMLWPSMIDEAGFR